MPNEKRGGWGESRVSLRRPRRVQNYNIFRRPLILMSGNCFFLSCFFSFVSPNCKGWQFAFVGGGAYPELKRAAGGDSSAVGCDSFVGRSQPKPNARARIRVSGVFLFLPSPLHPMDANCWATAFWGWRFRWRSFTLRSRSWKCKSLHT